MGYIRIAHREILRQLDNFEKNGLKDTILYKAEILNLKRLINEQNRILTEIKVKLDMLFEKKGRKKNA